MASIKIVTDSAGDIPRSLAEAEGIHVLPMQIYFDLEEFRDGVDITPSQFYARIRQSGVIPKTAQPLLSEVRRVFEDLSADGSSVIVIHLSSALSGTYSTSEMVAAEMAKEGADITVIDSLSASYGQGSLAVTAARMAKQGATRDVILKDIRSRIPRINHLFILDTIEYLMKGGRISKAEAFVGTVLDIKPYLYIDNEGKIIPKGKVRGRKRSIMQLLSEVEERITDPENTTLSVVHSDCSEEADVLIAELRQRFNPSDIIKTEMTATIGTHVGPGLLAVIFESDQGRD